MGHIVSFGGSFNPAGIHHWIIAKKLADQPFFDSVNVVVCGPRPDKLTTNDIDPIHRAVMTDLTFGSLGPKINVDLSDLELDTFTRTHELDTRYSRNGDTVWHAVGTDIIAGGSTGQSLIHRVWAKGPELWNRLKFVVLLRKGIEFDKRDLPPQHILLHIDDPGASETIRQLAAEHLPLDGLVVPSVASYIERHNLYRGGAIEVDKSQVAMNYPRPLIVVDDRRPEAVALANDVRRMYETTEPNFILTLGGDGTLLHAIKNHWRLRLPFFPIHFGTYGYLLNDVKNEVDELFFRQRFTTLRSPMFHIDAVLADGTTEEHLAFNDAWMQVEMGKTGWFEVSVNGETRFPKMMADGVLTATAAGSTAYARAMGAKPIPIGTNLFVLVGSNVFDPPHWGNGANLSLNSTVEFRSADPSRYRKIYGFVDGKNLGEVISMKIRMSRIAASEVLYLRYEDIQRKVTNAQFS